MYNADYRKRLPAEPHKLWKAGCFAMHALHELANVSFNSWKAEK
jgi:hypothetical protein